MRLAIAQLNPTIGDVAANVRAIECAIDAAESSGAAVLVLSEMVVLGYPPRDLLLRTGVVEACEEAVRCIAASTSDTAVILGYPRQQTGGEHGVRNSVAICRQGRIEAVYDKRLLPGYDVFDEDRYFDTGSKPCIVKIANRRVGILVCEDFWEAEDAQVQRHYEQRPVQDTIANGADVLVSLNASPFVIGKHERHVAKLRQIAIDNRVPIVSVNQAGANDDLIFDGRSLIMSSDGHIMTQLAAFEQHTVVIDLASSHHIEEKSSIPDSSEETFRSLVCGVRDYVRKTKHTSVVLGLSGGIDSALTATIAVVALGGEHVSGVLMPSEFSSAGSLTDASVLASNLGMAEPVTVPINDLHDAARSAAAQFTSSHTGGLMDQNVQARLRGLLLMAHTNATGALLLATGNKSELAMGYCTLYGDMCGALSVIGDLTKSQVYDLARWINEHHEAFDLAAPPIPRSSMTKPPSAELAPNQTDQDTLPPYELLDEIVRLFIDEEASVDRVIEQTGFDPELVKRTCASIDRAQYKREQSAIILKVSRRTFGRGRPMPVASTWRSVSAGAETTDQQPVCTSSRVSDSTAESG